MVVLPPLLRKEDYTIRRQSNRHLQREIQVKNARAEKGRRDYDRKLQAATMMQAVYRGRKTRSQMKDIIQERREARRIEKEMKEFMQLEAMRQQNSTRIISQLSNRDAGNLQNIVERISDGRPLDDLNLLDGCTDSERMDMIQILANFTTFEKLQLNRCSWDGKTVVSSEFNAFADAVQQQKQLITFRVTNANLDSGKASRLLSALNFSFSQSTLRELDISKNQIARGNWVSLDKGGNSVYAYNKDAILQICLAVKSLPYLESVDISHNLIGAKGASDLVGSKAFSVKRMQLRYVNLSNNDISSKGCYSIDQLVGGCPNLETLLIARNNIGHKGLAVIASSLSLHLNIRTIDLSENNLSDEGGSVVANILSSSISLRKLLLRKNYFGIEGITTIMKSVNRNKLEYLDISSNDLDAKIRDECLQAISTMIKYNKSLKHLIMQDMHMVKPLRACPVHMTKEKNAYYRPLEIITSQLSFNNTLEVIDMQRNNLTHEMVSRVKGFGIIERAIKLRPGLNIDNEVQLLVGMMFVPIIEKNPSMKPWVIKSIFMILAYAADVRQILV